jgi:Isochorismatase family
VGLAFDYCVGSTAYDAQMCGFDTHLLKDATRSVAAPFEEVMQEKLKNIGVVIHDSSDFLFETMSAPQPFTERQAPVHVQNKKNVDADEKTICLQPETAATTNVGFYDPYDAIPPSKEAHDIDEVQFKGIGTDW